MISIIMPIAIEKMHKFPIAVKTYKPPPRKYLNKYFNKDTSLNNFRTRSSHITMDPKLANLLPLHYLQNMYLSNQRTYKNTNNKKSRINTNLLEVANFLCIVHKMCCFTKNVWTPVVMTTHSISSCL